METENLTENIIMLQKQVLFRFTPAVLPTKKTTPE